MLSTSFLKLKQQSNSITHNPLLECFEQENLSRLDDEAASDPFVSEKKINILRLIKDMGIDFNPKLKSAYDEYTEALTYLLLKEKFPLVERVKEGKDRTPDFQITFNHDKNGAPVQCKIFAELKSMAFADGNLNYKKVMEEGVESQISIESQLKRGVKIAFGNPIAVNPLLKSNKKYEPGSTKYAIETLIEKIEQNIKEGQYLLGNTVLIVDLKQITLQTHFKKGAVPVFQEDAWLSLVSGVQWNTAFGKRGHLIYKPIPFDGKENIDGELEKDGILINRDYIQALIFLDYKLGIKTPKIIGLYKRKNITSCVEEFLHVLCDFVNDDRNTFGFDVISDHNLGKSDF